MMRFSNFANAAGQIKPEKRSGDCCSSGFVRTRYKWHNGRFAVFGPSEPVALEEPGESQ